MSFLTQVQRQVSRCRWFVLPWRLLSNPRHIELLFPVLYTPSIQAAQVHITYIPLEGYFVPASSRTYYLSTPRGIFLLMILLHNCIPPFRQVAALGPRAAQVYGILWESAAMDIDLDPNRKLPSVERRDCGGTTNWSKTALAAVTHAKWETISTALDQLLDAGFISAIGLAASSSGKNHLVYRVIHPTQLEAQREAISLIDEPPSIRAKRLLSTLYAKTGSPNDDSIF